MEHGMAGSICLATRRAADIGGSTKTPVYIVLLDWEKAFDNIRHGRIAASLRRLGLSEKPVRV
eukprot:3058821-Prorocentrum_lima.AAC.1